MTDGTNLLSWKSKRLSDKIIKAPATQDKIHNTSLDYNSTKARVRFSRNC